MKKKVAKTSKMTIDKLAILTKDGFDRHDKLFALMIKELKAMHEDHTSFRTDISALYTDNISYDRKIDNLTMRVEKLEMKSE